MPTNTGCIKWLAVGILLVTLFAAAPLQANTVSPSTGGGGGGTTYVFDPTLQTNNGITGISVTPEQYGAKGNGKICYDGAMTSGSSTLTSACLTGTVDNGKMVCVDGASASTVTDTTSTRHVELCGTVVTGGSGTATLSFSNASGGNITSKEVDLVSDDLAHIQAAVNAAAAFDGTVRFSPKIYGMSGTLVMYQAPFTASLMGWGNAQRDSWLANFSNSNGDATPLTLPNYGTTLEWATKSMSSTQPGIQFSGPSANKTVWWLNPVISNITLKAGAGTGYDGAGGDGIDFTDWWTAENHGVVVTGFKGAGMLFDVLGTSANDYVGQIYNYGTILVENGYGVSLGRSGGGGTSFLQNVFLNGATIENNLNDGITLAAPFHALVITNSAIQRNDSVDSSSFADINMSQACLGCTISQNYLEADFSNEKLLVGYSTSGNVQSPNVISNHFLCVLGGNYGIYYGNNSSNAQIGGNITGNYFTGCASGKAINIVAVQNLTVAGNTSTGETFDAIDYYNVAGALTYAVSAAGAVSLPQSQFSLVYSAAGTAVPTCNAGATHIGLCVSDSTACTNLTTYTSGGSTNCHLHCDGSNWKEDGFGC